MILVGYLRLDVRAISTNTPKMKEDFKENNHYFRHATKNVQSIFSSLHIRKRQKYYSPKNKEVGSKKDVDFDNTICDDQIGRCLYGDSGLSFSAVNVAPCNPFGCTSLDLSDASTSFIDYCDYLSNIYSAVDASCTCSVEDQAFFCQVPRTDSTYRLIAYYYDSSTNSLVSGIDCWCLTSTCGRDGQDYCAGIKYDGTSCEAIFGSGTRYGTDCCDVCVLNQYYFGVDFGRCSPKSIGCQGSWILQESIDWEAIHETPRWFVDACNEVPKIYDDDYPCTCDLEDFMVQCTLQSDSSFSEHLLSIFYDPDEEKASEAFDCFCVTNDECGSNPNDYCVSVSLSGAPTCSLWTIQSDTIVEDCCVLCNNKDFYGVNIGECLGEESGCEVTAIDAKLGDNHFTIAPTPVPTPSPTKRPTPSPTPGPTSKSTPLPITKPTSSPDPDHPSTGKPILSTDNPTRSPTRSPTKRPTSIPTPLPTDNPKTSPPVKVEEPTTQPPTPKPTEKPKTSPPVQVEESSTRPLKPKPTENPKTSPPVQVEETLTNPPTPNPTTIKPSTTPPVQVEESSTSPPTPEPTTGTITSSPVQAEETYTDSPTQELTIKPTQVDDSFMLNPSAKPGTSDPDPVQGSFTTSSPTSGSTLKPTLSLTAAPTSQPPTTEVPSRDTTTIAPTVSNSFDLTNQSTKSPEVTSSTTLPTESSESPTIYSASQVPSTALNSSVWIDVATYSATGDTYIYKNGFVPAVPLKEEDTMLVQNGEEENPNIPDTFSLVSFTISESDLPWTTSTTRAAPNIESDIFRANLSLFHEQNPSPFAKRSTYTLCRVDLTQSGDSENGDFDVDKLTVASFSMPKDCFGGGESNMYQFDVDPSTKEIDIDILGLLQSLSLSSLHSDKTVLLMIDNLGPEQKIGDRFYTKESENKNLSPKITISKLINIAQSTSSPTSTDEEERNSQDDATLVQSSSSDTKSNGLYGLLVLLVLIPVAVFAIFVKHRWNRQLIAIDNESTHDDVSLSDHGQNKVQHSDEFSEEHNSQSDDHDEEDWEDETQSSDNDEKKSESDSMMNKELECTDDSGSITFY